MVSVDYRFQWLQLFSNDSINTKRSEFKQAYGKGENLISAAHLTASVLELVSILDWHPENSSIKAGRVIGLILNVLSIST